MIENMRDLPIGFTLSLSMDLEAMNCYSSLSDERKADLIRYVSQPGPGDEPKKRIDQVINQLHNHQLPERFV